MRVKDIVEKLLELDQELRCFDPVTEQPIAQVWYQSKKEGCIYLEVTSGE